VHLDNQAALPLNPALLRVGGNLFWSRTAQLMAPTLIAWALVGVDAESAKFPARQGRTARRLPWEATETSSLLNFSKQSDDRADIS
jgi:hypothetical protein